MNQAVPSKKSFQPAPCQLPAIPDPSFCSSLLGNLPTFHWYAGPDRKYLYFNPAWLAFRGRTLVQELGDGWHKDVHPNDLELVRQAHTLAEESNRVTDLQFRLRCSDRSYRWIRAIVKPTMDAHGSHCGCVASCFDITEQKEILEKLLKQCQVIDKSPNIVFICNRRGQVDYMNANGSSLLGYAPHEVIGYSFHKFCTGLNSTETLDECINHILGGQEWHGELCGSALDGTPYCLFGVVAPITNASGKITCFAGVLNDITALKRAEESERRNHQLITGVSNATLRFLETNDFREMAGILLNSCVAVFAVDSGYLFTIDPSGEAECVSVAGKNVLGLTQEDSFKTADIPGAPGQPCNLFAPIIEERTILDRIDPGALYPASAPLDASETCCSFLGTPLKIGGKVIGMLALFKANMEFQTQDKSDLEAFSQKAALVLQHAQAELARKKALDDLRIVQKFNAIGKLAGGIAHDFNNILTIVNGYSELLKQKSTEENIRTGLGIIAEAGEKAADLTRQLLAFSSQQVMEPQILYLNALIHNLQKILRRLIREDINIRLDLNESLGQVRADPSQIEQILINLIINARDAMPEGGHITIATINAEFGDDFVSMNPGSRKGEYVMLSVRDDGIGMSEEILNQIFEPFFSTKPRESGTGLGLSTVYGIVKQSNGYIKAISNPGEGATVEVYLPRSCESTTREVISRPTEVVAGNETVLIVEDEFNVLQIAAQALRNYGYTVLEAGAPDEALRIAEQDNQRIDLLLTDMVMPEMSGSELARILRERHLGLKVLFMSGYGQLHADGKKVMDSETAFLQKPFKPQVLALRVQGILDQS